MVEQEEASPSVNMEERREEKEDEDEDEEGLLKKYDVILCGTGLVQSILASALSRAGKTVLHVDGADYYGGLDAVWTLPYLLELENNKSRSLSPSPPFPPELEEKDQVVEESSVIDDQEDDSTIRRIPMEAPESSLRFHSLQRQCWPVQENSKVVTPYGEGTVISLEEAPATGGGDNDDFGHLYTELLSWTLADGTSPHVYIGIPASCIATNENDAKTIDPEYLWTTHRVRTVQAHTAALVLDERSRSLALDVTPYLIYANGPAVAGLLVSSVAEYLEFQSLEGLYYYSQDHASSLLQRVPCSKNDVFASKLLSPMDKRRLMKFLQVALDYATAEALQQEEEEEEAEETMASDTEGKAAVDELQSWNERHLNQGRSLARPQNKAVANTDLERLQEFCQDNTLTLDEYLREHQKLSPSLIALVRYALALDTNENTSIRLGMKQLCAHMLALGRFGGTAFLVPLYGSGELSQAFCRSAAVYGATYLLRREARGIVVRDNQIQSVLLRAASGATKRIGCSHVVASDLAFPSRNGTSRKRLLRRISILCGKPIRREDGSQQPQRHVVVLPPGSIAGQTATIHGLLLDETVKVAPYVPDGCTVLHLTTTVDVAPHKEVDDSLLDKALRTILEGCVDGNAEVDEIFYVSFSYNLCQPGDEQSIDGLKLVRLSRPGLQADAAFEQAAEIFETICPGYDFLKMSEEVDKTVKETLGEDAFDEEDEEKKLLESAVGMIGDTSSSPAETTTSEAPKEASDLTGQRSIEK